jgi:SAM-dependent methyltransferase
MSFDTLAPFYRTMEFMLAGSLLQRCRTAYLPNVAGCRHALLLGEGPGRFLKVFLRMNPQAQVTCVERSPRMIEVAQRELSGCERARVQFVQADVLSWRPPQAGFDLVVTNFFLDCFRPEELSELVAMIAARATADAHWLLADFRQPERGWRRWRGRVVLTLMYQFFRHVTALSATRLTSPDDYLKAGGFKLSARRLGNFGLLHSDLWQRVVS